MARRQNKKRTMLNLKNKTALVTGGGTGIGQSIALHLAQEGCHLVLTGLGIDDLNKTKEQCEQYGVKAWAIETQLDDYSSIDRLHDYVIEQGLSIDLFVLNAGISQREKAFDTDISVDEKILKIDFLSGVYLVKKFKEMILAKEASTSHWSWNMTTSASPSSSRDASTRKSARAPSMATARPTPRWMPARPTASTSTSAAPSPCVPSNGRNTGNSSEKPSFCELLMAHIHKYCLPLYYKLSRKISAT